MEREASATEAEEKRSKKKKKVNFNLPFIISGLITGALAGAPYTQLVNYFYGVWGFLGGLFAAYLLSRSFKYFNYAQAAVLGMLSGMVAVAIAVGASLTFCFINFDTHDLYPAFINEKLIPAFEKAQMEQVKDKIILPPWEEVKESAEAEGRSAINDWVVLHVLYLIGTIICMAILGGFIGGVLFSKPIPKKSKAVRVMRRRLSASTGGRREGGESEGGPKEEKRSNGGEEHSF